MRYHPDDFLRLIELVEVTGGSQAEGRCEPVKFRLKQPDTKGEMRYKDFHTAGCRKEALFIVPYQKPEYKGEDDTMIEGGIGTGVFCAVDDSMGRWPRFQNAVKEDSF